jgi:hypothetical protein
MRDAFVDLLVSVVCPLTLDVSPKEAIVSRRHKHGIYVKIKHVNLF